MKPPVLGMLCLIKTRSWDSFPWRNRRAETKICPRMRLIFPASEADAPRFFIPTRSFSVSTCSDAMAVEWNGHLATLFDAQAACADTYSVECQPFLAEAVAVAEVHS